MSPDPQFKALQPQPQPPGQIQAPHPGSNPLSILGVKPVSVSRRNRSHSPCGRIDVDIEPEYQGGWRRRSTSMVPNDLSQSFPCNALHSLSPRSRSSFSPASNSFLKVPDNNSLLPPCAGTQLKGSSSMFDLTASAPADMLRQNLAKVKQRSGSYNNLLSPTSQISGSSLSPRTPPHSSSSSPGPWSICTFSPAFSFDDVFPNTAGKSPPPFQAHLILPNQACYPVVISPAPSPHCSPNGSPSGSQNHICINSVGAGF